MSAARMLSLRSSRRFGVGYCAYVRGDDSRVAILDEVIYPFVSLVVEDLALFILTRGIKYRVGFGSPCRNDRESVISLMCVVLRLVSNHVLSITPLLVVLRRSI